jgi:hypothetical protein
LNQGDDGDEGEQETYAPKNFDDHEQLGAVLFS